MIIKKVNITEIEVVMSIISEAIKLLGKTSLQWQQGYPNEEVMKIDISNGYCYGAFDKNHLIGIITLKKGIDENYIDIDGNWSIPLSDNDLQIHRIAVKEDYHGKKIGDLLIKFAIKKAKEDNCTSIKVDTHRVNYPMQHILINNQFSYAGIITLKKDEIDNTRLAYELKI